MLTKRALTAALSAMLATSVIAGSAVAHAASSDKAALPAQEGSS